MNILPIGTYFYRYHDSGAFGAKIVMGKILKVCPKTYLVRWEFGNTQYIKHHTVDENNIFTNNTMTGRDLIAEYEKDIARADVEYSTESIEVVLHEA